MKVLIFAYTGLFVPDDFSHKDLLPASLSQNETLNHFGYSFYMHFHMFTLFLRVMKSFLYISIQVNFQSLDSMIFASDSTLILLLADILFSSSIIFQE